MRKADESNRYANDEEESDSVERPLTTEKSDSDIDELDERFIGTEKQRSSTKKPPKHIQTVLEDKSSFNQNVPASTRNRARTKYNTNSDLYGSQRLVHQTASSGNLVLYDTKSNDSPRDTVIKKSSSKKKAPVERGFD